LRGYGDIGRSCGLVLAAGVLFEGKDIYSQSVKGEPRIMLSAPYIVTRVVYSGFALEPMTLMRWGVGTNACKEGHIYIYNRGDQSPS
jgi:hypothetical protein